MANHRLSCLPKPWERSLMVEHRFPKPIVGVRFPPLLWHLWAGRMWSTIPFLTELSIGFNIIYTNTKILYEKRESINY